MTEMGTLADKQAIEAEASWLERDPGTTVYQLLNRTAQNFGSRPAMTFQIRSGEKDKAETLNWTEFKGKVTQAANMFRALGIGNDDRVAYLLPNSNETLFTLLGGITAGIVCPINPTLEPEKIAELLRETNAKVLVTLKAFPKTDVAQLVDKALADAPNVKTVLEVDLKRYLTPPTSWIVSMIRPKFERTHKAQVLDFNAELAKHSADALTFEESGPDAVSALFHTGGTTGMPKLVQHNHRGMAYNGWCATEILFTEKDVLLCPLPLFHVMAAYAILMPTITSGAHMVMPTPAGYRGDGVFENFWKLVERWKVTFMVTVPTAASALMQQPVNADTSSLRYALCGSSPLPTELFKKFEAACGVRILEGYGMSEATCIVSCNPAHGEAKIGSVGLPFPYSDVKILDCDEAGNITREMGVDEIGEICVDCPGVNTGNTYSDASKNVGLFANGTHLRTGDLGRIDADGYVWITGRAKDLIIRGGHNIDPALIEEALAGHPDVAFVGAIGQPDAHAGELPCAYVELIEGATATNADLLAYAQEHVGERAAVPKYLEVMDELPKTAVGKIFKPDLRRSAITRIFEASLAEAGLEGRVTEVIEDKKRGLVARIDSNADDTALTDLLGQFATKWERAA